MLLRRMTDAEVVADLGRRVAEHRVARDMTQSDFADFAGVARSTVQRIERGDSIQLNSFVKILRAFGRLDGIDALLSPEIVSPIAELERTQRRRMRVRKSAENRSGSDEQPSTDGGAASHE